MGRRVATGILPRLPARARATLVPGRDAPYNDVMSNLLPVDVDKAFPYEDQAIDILIANTNLVTDDIYDQWVKKSFGALAELIPGRYAKFEQVESYVDIIY